MADTNSGFDFDGIKDSGTEHAGTGESFNPLIDEMFGAEDGADSPDEMLVDDVPQADEEAEAPEGEEPEAGQSGPPAAEPEDPDEDDDEGDEEEPEEDEPKPKGSRAQKRIQQLAARSKELEQQLSQVTQQSQLQFQSVLQQQEAKHQAQMDQMQQLIEVRSREAELMQAKQSREEDQNLSEVDRFAAKIERETMAKAESLFDSKLEALQSKMDEQEAAHAERQQKMENQRVFERVSQRTEAARNSTFFKGFNQESITPEVGQAVDDTIMALAAARNIPIEEAASFLSQLTDIVGQKRQATKKAAKSKPKVKPAKAGLPSSARQAAKGGEKAPSLQEIKEMGFNNHLRWAEAGSPKPRSKK